jgi:uncharacterized protein YbcI
MTRLFVDRLARQVAHAAGTFEHLLLGRSPTSVSVVATRDWMVVNLHEPFSGVERRLAADAAGADRVRNFHHYLFQHAVDSFIEHVREATGVQLRGAMAHVDVDTGSVLKTFTTHPDVDLFLFGQGLPTLGVPVDAHLHASCSQSTRSQLAVDQLDGERASPHNGPYATGGRGAVRA